MSDASASPAQAQQPVTPFRIGAALFAILVLVFAIGVLSLARWDVEQCEAARVDSHDCGWGLLLVNVFVVPFLLLVAAVSVLPVLRVTRVLIGLLWSVPVLALLAALSVEKPIFAWLGLEGPVHVATGRNSSRVQGGDFEVVLSFAIALLAAYAAFFLGYRLSGPITARASIRGPARTKTASEGSLLTSAVGLVLVSLTLLFGAVLLSLFTRTRYADPTWLFAATMLALAVVGFVRAWRARSREDTTLARELRRPLAMALLLPALAVLVLAALWLAVSALYG
jgi:hypothetical protein